VITDKRADPILPGLADLIMGNEHPVFAFGATERVNELVRLTRIDAVVDDVYSGSHFCGLPVVRSGVVTSGSYVLSTIIGNIWKAKSVFADKDIKYVDFFQLYNFYGSERFSNRFLNGFQEFYSANLCDLRLIGDSLEDLESRMTLSSLINFRLTYNTQYLRDFTNRTSTQYFENFLYLGRSNECTFLDVGSFDGTDALKFASRFLDFRKIHCFEPIDRSFKELTNNIKIDGRILAHKVAVGARTTTARFSDEGTCSTIASEGGEVVDVVTIDDFISDGVDYIKLDIEGSEMDALTGAIRTISKNKPSIAVCVYHRPEHLLECYNFLKPLLKGHKIYLRHYTEGVVETVLYFIRPDEISP
jgi:FkbM family methyltransferase